jgi:hypothetical protein
MFPGALLRKAIIGITPKIKIDIIDRWSGMTLGYQGKDDGNEKNRNKPGSDASHRPTTAKV